MAESRSIISSSDDLISSDELRKIFCEPCGKVQQKTMAEGFCVDCSEYLCGHCYSYHRRLKQFEQHVLQDKDNMPLDINQVQSTDVCLSKCPFHLDKVIDYVCKSCDKIGCHVCMTINHRSCEIVRYIPDEMNGDDISGEIHALAKMIDEINDKQRELHEIIGKNFQMTEEMNKTALMDIDRQKCQIVSFFVNLYDLIKTKVVRKQLEDNKLFKTLLKEVRAMQTDMQNRKTRLQHLEKSRQFCEAFIFTKNTHMAIEEMSKKMVELSKNGEEKLVRYMPSIEVDELKDDIKDLGCLITKESEHKTQIPAESIKKRMEKELQMIRREKADLKDELNKNAATIESLRKKESELKSRVNEEEQVNKNLKADMERLRRESENRLDELRKELHDKEEQEKDELEIERQFREDFERLQRELSEWQLIAEVERKLREESERKLREESGRKLREILQMMSVTKHVAWFSEKNKFKRNVAPFLSSEGWNIHLQDLFYSCIELDCI